MLHSFKLKLFRSASLPKFMTMQYGQGFAHAHMVLTGEGSILLHDRGLLGLCGSSIRWPWRSRVIPMTLLLLPRVIVPIAVLAPPPFHQCRSSYFHALCVIMPIAVLAPPPFQCLSSYFHALCAMRHHADCYPRTPVIPVSLISRPNTVLLPPSSFQ